MNLLLHSINTLLVVVLAARLLQEIPRRDASDDGPAFPDRRTAVVAAAAAGLLFGIHPQHVESVVWVAERKDLLCALFFLLSMMAFLDYKSHKSYKGYILALLFF